MGWGTPPTQSWVRSSAGALPPSWSPYRALAALQAPSCPQNPVVQPSLHPQEDEDGPGHIKGTLRRGHPWHTAAPCPPCSPIGAAPCESEAGRAELAAGHRSPRGSGARKRAANTGRGRAGGTSQPAAPSRSPACRPRLPLGLRSSPICEMKGTSVGHASCGEAGHPELAGFRGFSIWEGRNPLPMLPSWERFSRPHLTPMVPRDKVPPRAGTRRCSPTGAGRSAR